MMTNSPESNTRRRRSTVRFRLRWMFLMVAVVATLFAWMAPSIHRRMAWQRAISPIRSAGGSVAWFADTEPSPLTAASISLGGSAITDDDLAAVTLFSNSESINLKDTQVTDAGLEHLTSLRSLQWIDLRGTHVTDAGVDDLRKALPRTEIVH